MTAELDRAAAADGWRELTIQMGGFREGDVFLRELPGRPGEWRTYRIRRRVESMLPLPTEAFTLIRVEWKQPAGEFKGRVCGLDVEGNWWVWPATRLPATMDGPYSAVGLWKSITGWVPLARPVDAAAEQERPTLELRLIADARREAAEAVLDRVEALAEGYVRTQLVRTLRHEFLGTGDATEDGR